MSVEEVGELITKGTVGPLEGFISRFGKKFSAKIKLDEELKPKYDFEGQPSRAIVTLEELLKGEVMGPCPVCGSPVHIHANGFACEKTCGEKPECGFKLPKILLTRELPPADVQKLLRKEETSPIEGFLSKKGKKFNAILYLKKGGALGWKFPPRPKKEKVSKTKGEKPAEEPKE